MARALFPVEAPGPGATYQLPLGKHLPGSTPGACRAATEARGLESLCAREPVGTYTDQLRTRLISSLGTWKEITNSAKE